MHIKVLSAFRFIMIKAFVGVCLCFSAHQKNIYSFQNSSTFGFFSTSIVKPKVILGGFSPNSLSVMARAHKVYITDKETDESWDIFII